MGFCTKSVWCFVSELPEKRKREKIKKTAKVSITGFAEKSTFHFLSLVGLQVGNSVRGAIKDPVALADGSYVQCDNTRLTPFRYPHYSYHLCCVFFFFVCLYGCKKPTFFPHGHISTGGSDRGDGRQCWSTCLAECWTLLVVPASISENIFRLSCTDLCIWPKSLK